MTIRLLRGLGGRRLGIAVLVVANVVALVTLPSQQREADDAARGLRETAAAMTEAARQEAGLVLDNADRQTAIGRTRDAQRSTTLEADTAAARLDEQRTRLDETESALAATQAALDRTAARLDEISAALGLQRLLIAPLEVCLGGIEVANNALQDSDHDAAGKALGESSDACMQVRSRTAPPAFPYDFPDPHVVKGPSGRWWAYATNSTAGAVQMISSADLVEWRVEGNALAALPGWSRPGATWAPAVIGHGGRWLLYYTAREDASGLQCISVATAASPAGPFRDETTEPLVCERDEGGSIDPDPVVDGEGTLHLLWKTELDTIGDNAELRGARLDATGTEVAGPVKTLLHASSAWEGRTIEGPAMLRSNGYHLLYSGGSWNRAGYAVGAARCESVLGPCTRTSATPVLATTGPVVGPGGLSVFSSGHGPAVAFHAWEGTEVGYPESRFLHIGSVSVADGTVTVLP